MGDPVSVSGTPLLVELAEILDPVSIDVSPVNILDVSDTLEGGVVEGPDLIVPLEDDPDT